MTRSRRARAAACLVAALATVVVVAVVTGRPVLGAPHLGPRLGPPIEPHVERHAEPRLEPPIGPQVEPPAEPQLEPPNAPLQVPPLQLTTRPETLPPPPKLTPQPETQPPPPDFTRVPTSPPVAPTAFLPTAVPPGPGDDDDDDRNDRDDRGDQQLAPVPQQSTGEASPTRTRRATRTPRTTATPTPTPIPAGSLRVTLVSYPGLPAMGESVEFHIAVANRTDGTAHDLTLQSRVPPDLIVESIEADEGQTARAEDVIRWYIPHLAAGDSAILRLRGVLSRAPASGIDWCATLLSAGAPLEQCARFEVATGGQADLGPETGDATEPPPRATVQPTSTNLPIDVSPTVFGWSVLIVGLAVLGLWLGLVLRGRRD